VDEVLLQVTRSGTSYVKNYCHSNHLYSLAAVTDAAGNVVERYRYDAYGKRVVLDANGLPMKMQDRHFSF
jgi:YD repeat-containing protein